MTDEQTKNTWKTEGTVLGNTEDPALPDVSSDVSDASPNVASKVSSSNVVSEASSNTAASNALSSNVATGVSSNVASDISSNTTFEISSFSVASANVKKRDQMWTKEDLDLQIRSFENQFSLIEKRNVRDRDKVKDLKESIVKLIVNFEENEFCLVEQNVLDTKEKIYEIINKMTRWEKTNYFISLWGITPIGIAVIAMILAFSEIASRGSSAILGVPLWASFIAVAGTSVQILIGVANDYKDDCMITEYKRLWYIVLPFISFVFGFIAFLLTSAGLISIASANQDVSMSAVSAGFSSSSSPPAICVIICFLAGYATDWFMGLLLKYTSEK